MRVAEHVANLLVEHGITHIFAVTGGSNLFLIDAFCKHANLQVVFCHHEQACSMAADAYYRVHNKMACVCVTSGPGGLNAINGVFGAWTDSIPMLVLSGQVRTDTMRIHMAGASRLRQLGDQECTITEVVRSITKEANTATIPEQVVDAVDFAIQSAKANRGGPCWVDIPVNVQAAELPKDFAFKIVSRLGHPSRWSISPEACTDVIQALVRSRSPVLIGGTGVRLSDACKEFGEFANRTGIPVVTAWNHDLIESSHRCFVGRQGTLGDRAGNIAVQNADLLLVIGSRLGVRHTSLNWKTFAPKCKEIIWVDIDTAEMQKPTIGHAVSGIRADARAFLVGMLKTLRNDNATLFDHWREWCLARRFKYPAMQEKYCHQTPRSPINPYYFMDVLWRHLRDDDVVVCGDATATIVSGQVAYIRGNQRILTNSGCASMGWDLPAAVGAAFARGGKRVICLAGDGSIQLNIQELATIRQYDLPVKLFVLNNGGYLSIRSSQKNLGLAFCGESTSSGLFFPRLRDISHAYSIPHIRLYHAESLEEAISEQFADNDFLFMVEVDLDPEQGFEPRMQSRLVDGELISSSLDNLYPFLSPEEQAANVYVPPPEKD